MLENQNLKPIEEFDIDINDINEDDIINPIELKEVCRKGNLILYECDDDSTIGPLVTEEVVNEIFPEFETDFRKCYLIEDNGKFYC